MFQNYEAGGLNMVDVQCFFVDVKDFLVKKTVMMKNIKNTIYVVSIACRYEGEFANGLMLHYKKRNSECIPLPFDEFAPEKLRLRCQYLQI